MVILGCFFILLFIITLIWDKKGKIANTRWLQYVGLWSIPLGYIAGQARLDRSGGRTSALGYTGYLADQRFDIQVKPVLGTDHFLPVPYLIYDPADRRDWNHG